MGFYVAAKKLEETIMSQKNREKTSCGSFIRGPGPLKSSLIVFPHVLGPLRCHILIPPFSSPVWSALQGRTRIWNLEVSIAAEDYDKGMDQYLLIHINTIFRGMNIHLPAILMFTRGTIGFDTLPQEPS